MTSMARLSSSGFKKCMLCSEISFKSLQAFKIHLRECHSKKEGGSYVCSYGLNSVCSSLPLEGVSERDYEFHVAKHHTMDGAGDCSQQHEERLMEDLRHKYQHLISSNQENQPNVVADQFRWTIYDCTMVLPNILNDPRRVKREADLFTKHWGDGFVDNPPIPYSPFVVNIEPVHFEQYLKYIKKRVHLHSREAMNKRFYEQQKASTPLMALVSSLGDIANEIEDVPKIFMQAQFHLEKSEVFEEVLPWSQLYGHLLSEGKIVRSPQNSVKLLQEKLSHFLDVVEVQIARQVAMKSEDFFYAMTSHDDLVEKISNIVESIFDIRKKIGICEQTNVKLPFKVMELKIRQWNFIQVYNKLKLMATVQQTQPTIQLLLSTSEFVGALDLIFTTQDILIKELAGIRSFRHLSSQLSEMEKVIGEMMKSDFYHHVTDDLNRPPTEEHIMDEDRLVAIVFGMLRQKQFSFIEVFKEECYTAIDTTVKQSIIEIISQAEDFENGVTNVFENIISLDLTKWLDLLQLTLKNLKFLLKRIQALYQVMVDISDASSGEDAKSPSGSGSSHSLQAMEGDEIMMTQKDYWKVKNDLKALICAVCDRAHDGAAKIVSAKAKDGSLDKLTTSDFAIVAHCIQDFKVYCEGLCGRQSNALMLALQMQASRFVCRFHDDRKAKLGLLLDNEQWQQSEVPLEFQQLVDHIVSSSLISVIKENSSEHFRCFEKKTQSCIVINNEKFAIVGTALMLFKMVIEYCQCSEDVDMVAFDLAAKLVELLKYFNTRSYGLVLGAGAMQLHGLKTITAKHLALMSRCLKLITFFLPQVKLHFTNKIPQKQEVFTKHFDLIMTIYFEHVQEINSRLDYIISNMFEAQLRQWQVKAPVPSSCFRSICKSIGKFHGTLVDLLPPEELEDVFLRMNVLFKLKLKKHLLRLQVNLDGGPQHGLVTQELTFYVQNLKNLNRQYKFNFNDLWEPRT